ncbi:amidohydrolase [Breznakiella homolactica]|uniref:Amidohydrolase n=1 Tax=Breznakiella homolactica TaxID=2798577 RepID=A0A7T7XM41_9SPIR|nr:amidohydrolase [Breznakiella homolactica]QQO08896.1 amidohydrolase [Breznakiella homolactica]
MAKNTIISVIEQKKDDFIRIAQELWKNPELSHEEKESSALQKKYLREAGFRVTELDHIQDYAFVAEWGSGSPVIGLLGEFDALPGLSQKVQTTQEPVVPGAPGHGCGHNILGTALLGAAVGVKAAIDAGLLSGTIRYIGAPAEEQLGKPVLAKAGVFSDLDAAFGYHPSDLNTVAAFGTNASIQLTFKFHGIPAHAAQVPHLGRSALDALTLMQVGTEFLREHMPTGARIHYVVTSGGERANIVPDFASGDFQVRCPRMRELIPLIKRVIDVAKGAAMMTGTTVEYAINHGCYDVIANKAMSDLLYENLKAIDIPQYTPEELDFCRKLADTLTPDQRRNTLLGLGVDPDSADDLMNKPIHDGIGYWGIDYTIPASTDVGDVSHITPVAQVYTAAYPIGIGAHTWQATAASGSTVGMKGMIYASKIFGCACYDIMTKKDVLAAAKEEWKKSIAGEKYVAAEDLLGEIEG